MSKLVVLSGVPGSGKSFFSSSLRKAKGSHVYIVSSDTIRTMVLGTQQDFSADEVVWSMFYKLVYAYASDPDGIVVLDATHSNSFYRINATKKLKPLFGSIDLVSFNLPRSIINEQNKNRPFPVPEDALDLLCAKFEVPDEKDKQYFHHIYIIDSHEIDSVINSLIH